MYGYDSRVRVSEVDENRKMTLNAVLNYFQDCSSFHSEDLGVGAVFLENRNRMWVLSSWKIVIRRYPEMTEHIRVETWPYEFSKITGRRNFRMLDGQGEVVAWADTLWVYMDTVRMRPCKLEKLACVPQFMPEALFMTIPPTMALFTEAGSGANLRP